MDPMSQMFQWLWKEERQKGIKDSETAHLFTDNRKELKQLADAIRRQELNAASRSEVMSGGEVLGTALIAWLKEEDEDIGIAMRVVEAVWPRVCLGRAQAHPDWTQSCETKLDLIQAMESWVRMNSARCARHLSKLEYRCPKCQHGMCTTCNEIEGRIHLNARGVWSLLHKYPTDIHSRHTVASTRRNVSISMPWGSSGLKKSQMWKSALREKSSSSRPISEGGRQRLGKKDVNNC